MRALRVDATDRPAPSSRVANPRAQSRPGETARRFSLFGLFSRSEQPSHAPARPGARKRSAPRRKPLPAWFKPAMIGGSLLLSAAVLGGGGWWLQHSGRIDAALERGHEVMVAAMIASGLTVQEIDVQGRQATSSEALLAAVGIERGDPILLFDADAARERIEHIGWVKTATVQRILPGTILLRIVERRPFARWQIDGRTVLIDRDGKVLEEGDPSDFRDLRRVVGPGAADHVGELFDMLMAEPALFARARDAIRVRDRRWDIELDNGVTVHLPEQGAEVAWRHLAILDREQKLLDKAVVAIDLRLPDRTVVRLTPEAAQMRRPVAKVSGKPT